MILLLYLPNLKCLPVIKWKTYPCGYNRPTAYDSALLVEGESLHLSCSVCANCEPNIQECKKDFNIAKWIQFLRTKTKKKNSGDLYSSDVSTIRDRYFYQN